MQGYCDDKERCRQGCANGSCDDCRLEWLKQEHKEQIKLSESERIILENIDERYKWIARDGDGSLYVFGSCPHREENGWWSDREAEAGCTGLGVKSFQFVKWEDKKPYNIAELLEK